MRRKLSDETIEMIKVLGEFVRPVPLGREYGVHPDTIRNILAGKSHRASHQAPRRDRKIPDTEIREMRRLASKEGMREHAIKNHMQVPYSRSTIRQVIDGLSYKDVT